MDTYTNNYFNDLIRISDLLTLEYNAPFGLILINGKETEYINRTTFNYFDYPYTDDYSNINLLEFVFPDDRNKLIKLISSINKQKTITNKYQLTIRGANYNDKNRFFNTILTNSLLENTHRIQIIITDISDEIEKSKLLNQLAFESLMSIQKNETLDEVRKELESLVNEKKYKKNDFDKIFKALSHHENRELEWAAFTNHFEGLCPNFMTNLQLLYPNLTINEIKHCACIRLKLSTKEIAKFFNVAPTTIQIARVRLKKKMNLDEHIDLRKFIYEL